MKDTQPEWHEINGAQLAESEDESYEYQNGIKLANEDEMAEHTEYLIVRHRLDVAKLYLNKEGGYSLRKFKKIFKREMAEHPEKYVVMRPGAKFHKEETIIETKAEEPKEEEKPASDAEQLSDIDDEAGEADAAVQAEDKIDAVAEVNEEEDDGNFKRRRFGRGPETEEEKMERMTPEELEEYHAKVKEESEEAFKRELEEMKNDSEDEFYHFEEDEFEEMLEQVEKEMLYTEEDAIKFFE